MSLRLAAGTAHETHQEAASRLGVELLASYPQEKNRSVATVRYTDGCEAVIVVQHHPIMTIMWEEQELSTIERDKVSPESRDTWFFEASWLPAVKSSCEEHTAPGWRNQLPLPSQRVAGEDLTVKATVTSQ